ncbi:MAG: thiol-disulfide isomerase/thioredoxin [Flavobacteriaceae bacterium]|jgi:thiol-disulfide isomerase/thioredoxin
MKLRSISILLAIFLILLFMYSPLGNTSKINLTKWLAPAPTILPALDQYKVSTYEWRLKDKDWNFFSFKDAKGKMIFVHFWASWHLPSKATLGTVQKFYNQYKDEVIFYIVTDEEIAPVLAFMKEQKYDFPVTYRVVGDQTPFNDISLGVSYLIDNEGKIIVEELKASNWDDQKLFKQLRQLLDK